MAQENFDIVENSKAKSAVWEYFGLKKSKETNQILQNVAVCKRCNMTVKYSGGTTNLSVHLERHHKVILSTRTRLKVTPSAEEKQPSETTNKLDINANSVKQNTLSGMFKASVTYNRTSVRHTAITDAISRFIVKDLRPFSIVTNEGFQNLIKTLDPRYEIPSRTYFSVTAIPQMYKEARLHVIKQIESARCVALTTDGWTSRATESYITITATMIDEAWSMKTYVLQTRQLSESHTGVNIAAVLLEAIEEWKLPAKPALVTDNAANMGVAAEIAGCNPHIGCFAHTLNIAAQKATKIPSLSKVLAKVRRIVGFFHRSTTAAALLKSKTKEKEMRNVRLIQDVATRWNSTLNMIERYLELKSAVFDTLTSPDIKKDPELCNLSDVEIGMLHDAMRCLLPLRDVTEAICSETSPTLSIVLPIQIKLFDKILKVHQDDPCVVRQMKKVVSDDLAPRYRNLTSFLEETTALDPRFKTQASEEEQSPLIYSRLSQLAVENTDGRLAEVKVEPGTSGQNTQVESSPLLVLPTLPGLDPSPDPPTEPESETSSPPKIAKFGPKGGLAGILEDVIFVKTTPSDRNKPDPLAEAEAEVKRYADLPCEPLNSNPLLWWKSHEKDFPKVAEIARKRLCIPATSVPSERVFSTAGDIVTSQRACLDQSCVDKLIFLKKNTE